MFKHLTNQFQDWLTHLGLSTDLSKGIIDYSILIALIIGCYVVYIIARFIIRRFAHSFANKTKSHWDDIMINRRVFARLSMLIPLIVFSLSFKYILADYHPLGLVMINGLVKILISIASLSIILALINSFNDIYESYSVSKSRPIKGYLQVAKIIAYVLVSVSVISILLGRDGFGWIAGFGAFSAVLMLVFKDPILGFVGGIQLASNNMVKIGDWISMPKYGADGTVNDITLTTVKVQNWDKTITTIPTYTLVTDYFQNWRGMEESGGRRIKRSINIDMRSVKFCSQDMLDRFRKIQILTEYLDRKNDELKDYNTKYKVEVAEIVNGRRQTNLGVFRAYLKEYLKRKPEINTEMTFLVRQIQSSENGIPIEIYVFSKIKDWALYEDIQSDIFDHILAVIPEFGLRVFQHPTGEDFARFGDVAKLDT